MIQRSSLPATTAGRYSKPSTQELEESYMNRIIKLTASFYEHPLEIVSGQNWPGMYKQVERIVECVLHITERIILQE